MTCYWSILLSTCRKVSVVMLMSDTLTKERQQRLLSCIFAPFLYQILFFTGVSWKKTWGLKLLPCQFLQICIQLYWSSLIKVFFTVKLKVLMAEQKRLMPNPSASSNIFWPCSNIFDRVQYLLNAFKYFWPCSNM